MQITLPRWVATDASFDRRAPRVLAFALALGLCTQALFFHADLGVSFLVFDALVVLVTLHVLGHARLAFGPRAVSSAALLFGVATVLHRGALASFVAAPLAIVSLLTLPVVAADNLRFSELHSLPMRLLWVAVGTPEAVGRTLTLPRDAISGLGETGRSAARRTALGVVLGLPITFVFTLLLCADSGFAGVVGRVEGRTTTAITFAIQAVVSAVVFAFGYALVRPAPKEPSAVPTPDAPYRTHLAVTRPLLSPLTWGIVVAQVALVFLVFVAVRRDTEFGGHAVVRGRADLTYASHLHAGFYQLIFATLLAVGLVVLGHRLLGQERGQVPGGRLLSALEGTLLVLTGVALYSCVNRLRLYEQAYGATHLRVGVGFVCLLAAVVIACALVKAVFRGLPWFESTTMVALTACALAFSFFDADAYVARTNLDRALSGKALDEAHLASLSADACRAADHPYLRERPELRARLIEAWAKPEAKDPRELRGLSRCPAMLP